MNLDMLSHTLRVYSGNYAKFFISDSRNYPSGFLGIKNYSKITFSIFLKSLDFLWKYVKHRFLSNWLKSNFIKREKSVTNKDTNEFCTF